jgi:hypothetical protein
MDKKALSEPIEGCYLETKQDMLIFDVKGIFHPKDKVISFIRFYPHPEGERMRNGVHYKKIYDLKERYKFLRTYFPKYLFHSKHLDMELQGIKREDIKKVYTPREYLDLLRNKNNLKKYESDALKLCDLFIRKGEISENSIGVTGSQMVDLNEEHSDIDLIIYGTETARNFQKQLSTIFKDENGCRKYTFEEYKKHYRFRARGAGISFNDFLRSEQRKNHQGKYYGIDFFIRYIKSPEDWKGSYEDYYYSNAGRIKMKAAVIDSEDSLFTPCSYKIDALRLLNESSFSREIDMDKIREINSYRGRFCEHARAGESIMVEGKLEKVRYKKGDAYYRVLLGNQKKDKMIIL